MIDDIALIFSGGSTKVPLHVGAQVAIEEAGIKPVQIWGNSCGSIIASALAVGLSIKELEDITLNLDFDELVDQKWYEHLYNLIFNRGFVSPKGLVNFLLDILGDKTFEELDTDLCVMGHSLTKRTYAIFNKKNYPKTPVWKAVQISTCIPFFFTPVNYMGEWWVDGGVSKGFPIDLCDNRFIGHLIQDPHDPEVCKTVKLPGMVSVILSQLLHQSSENSIQISSKYSKTFNLVVRTDYSKPCTQFVTSQKEKISMMELGYNNMKNALADYIDVCDKNREMTGLKIISNI